MMLTRTLSPGGVVYYASPLLSRLGVPHAFGTRHGGVSGAPFDSLNLGNPGGCDVQDDAANIRENYRRLAEACGCGGREIRRVKQVHGDGVVVARADQVLPDGTEADALLTDDPACAVSVRVADCVPILLASGDGRLVTAVHAGWRGVVARVVPAALDRMRRMRGDSGRYVAAVGPCLGIDAFEVGPEVLDAFEKAFGPAAPLRRRPDGKGHVDLRAAVRLQLLECGLAAGEIDATDRCTFRDADDFFSHRRDRGRTGRLAAIVAPA